MKPTQILENFARRWPLEDCSTYKSNIYNHLQDSPAKARDGLFGPVSTFRKGVLRHLGIKPGERIEMDLLPDGRAALRAVQQKAPFRKLQGFLKGKTDGKVLTIEGMGETIAQAGAVAGASE
jgi:hypothetical protein